MVRLFWQDPYLREFEAEVVEVSGDKVVLDQTAFYAESGGQIGDTGVLGDVRVLDTQYSKSGKTIYHVVEPSAAGRLRKRARAIGRIDWDRRYWIMRHHSGLHLVYLVFEQFHGPATIIGSQVRDDKARVDFAYFQEVDLQTMEDRLNEIIALNRSISLYPSEKDPEYRFWSAEGFTPVPCGGTHVRSTGEIGPLRLQRKSLGNQGVRIYCRCAELPVDQSC